MTSIACKWRDSWWAVSDLNTRPKDYESKAFFKVINGLPKLLFRIPRAVAPLKASNGAGRLRIAEWFLVLSALLLTACGGGGSSTPAPVPAASPPFAPAPSAPSVGVHIVAFGDSTQAAQGNPHASSRPGWTIENKGISGSSTTQWVAKWSDELAATKAPIVIYNGGLNDGGLTLEEYKHALRELVRITRAYKKQIILEQPNNADASGDIILPTFIERRAAVEGVAKSEGVYYCAQPDVPLRDGIHPTDAGYAAKAGRLAECLKDAI